MEEKVLKPKLRFKGFEDAWEHKKFEDLYKYASEGGTPDTNNLDYYINGNIPFVKIEDTQQKYIKETISYINEKGLNNSSAWLIPTNSIIFTNGATVGNVAINSIPVSTKQGILGVIPKEIITTEYMYYLLSSTRFQKEVDSRMATGTFATIILKELNKINISIASSEEQTRIGTFFTRLDSLIDLSDKRIKSLKSIKSSLLSKLFCEGPNLKPCIRFKGFEDAWEEKRLGELGKTFTGLSGKTAEDFGHGKAKFLPYLNIFTNPIADVNFLESIEIDNSQNQIQKGDIFFTVSSETPEEVGMSSVWLGNIRNVYLNSFCFGFRPSADLDPYYMGFLLRSDAFRKPVTILAQGISRFNISKNKVMDIKIPLPVKQEQQKIGKFFEKLDELIALESKKSEKLRNIKSSLLNSMFC